MFIETEYEKGKPKMYALNRDSLHVRDHGVFLIASVEVIYYSSSRNTLGQFTLGEFSWMVHKPERGEGWVPTFDEFMRNAITVSRPNQGFPSEPERVYQGSSVILSEENVWSVGGEGALNKLEYAISLYRRQDDLPDNWVGWFKHRNKR